MIELCVLPARDGDCLLLSYGNGALTHRILIDGGRAQTYSLIKPMLEKIGMLDLLVVTHVDQDHILGVLAMLEDLQRPVQFGDIWFNGYDQLRDAEIETFGARDGEKLTAALLEQNLPWNKAFSGRAVRCDRQAISIGGASLTLLSPDRDQLAALVPVWEKECSKEGLMPDQDAKEPPDDYEQFGPINVDKLADEKFTSDNSKTNPTSIGFLFEYDGARIVFTGDGDDFRLRSSLQPLADAAGGRLRIDALKVPHHGSRANLSKETLAILECATYIISTDGSRHQHPDDVTMARILKYGAAPKGIAFNYLSRAANWKSIEWQATYGYVLQHPKPDQDGCLTLAW